MKKTVVILYSKNHYDQTALALKEEYSKNIKDAEVILVDEDHYCNFKSSVCTNAMYRFTMRNMPWMNGLLGYVSNTYFSKVKAKEYSNVEQKQEKEDGFFNKIKTSLRKVDNIVERFDPDVVVCTTTKALSKALYAKYRLNSHATICAVMTDYCTNRAFNNPVTDAYLVQNNGIKQTLITLGIAEEKIQVLKTPIRNEVKKEFDKQQVFEELNIENTQIPTVLLVGGRYGSGKMKNAFKDIAVYHSKMNIIVMTNNSENIKTFVNSYCKSLNITSNVYCIDSIDNMAKLYSIAECVISTPTASITYEAMSRNIPCVLIKYSNYIEEGNFSYLVANGFAMRGEKTTHLVPSVLSCINKDDAYMELMENIKDQFPQECAKDYAEYILSIAAEKPVVEVVDVPVEEEQKEKEEKPKKKDKKEKKAKK